MAEPLRRVHILGGGVGALATAWHLTAEPDWRQRYEITVWQMGWRLGGKCASSRNLDRNLRSEEHGLHVWFGFYENAFAMLRGVYADPLLPKDSPLYAVDRAFHPQDYVCLLDGQTGPWNVWSIPFPRHAGEPGTPGAGHTLGDALFRLLGWLADTLQPWLHEAPAASHPLASLAGLRERLDPLADSAFGGSILGLLRRLFAKLDHAALALLDTLSDWLVHRLDEFRDWLRSRLTGLSRDVARIIEVAEIALAALRGLFADHVFARGLSAIDGEEFRGWLQQHGATAEALASTPLRALYDCCFAYENGDVQRPNFAAGTALGCALRIGLLYRGAVLYELNAGIGDVVMAPLYRVLAARGVRFEFFQKVTRLEPSADGRRIARVHFEQQATVRDGRYDPLLRIDAGTSGSLPIWPDRPRYEQLVEGEALRASGQNLESAWSSWQPVRRWALEPGPEDRVVLGIALGALPALCAELPAKSPRWGRLFAGVPSIQTQSIQLWLDRPLQALGWTHPRPAMVAAPEVFDVWADMSSVLDGEPWPERAARGPRSLHYLCGPLPGDWLRDAPRDPAVPARATAQVRAQAHDWLARYTGQLWPNAVSPPGSEALDWSLLHAPEDVRGEARLDAQLLHPNIDPSERYVLSPAGGNLARLSPDDSGFDNLVLAGDWTRQPINAGCVEGAVMSGMAASRAISGWPQTIAGEHFLDGSGVAR